MNVLKHVCGISLCITMPLSNLSPQTSSFSPTLQTFLSPLSSSLHIQILQCAELGGAPLNLHPHPTNPPPRHPSLSRKDPARSSLSWTGKTPAPPVRNLLLEASWMNNPNALTADSSSENMMKRLRCGKGFAAILLDFQFQLRGTAVLL